MNKLTKALLVISGTVVLGGCVEDQATLSGYSSHSGYGYSRYSASSVNSGYNSHYGKPPQQNKSGGYQGHAGNSSNSGYRGSQAPTQKRWYSAGRTNRPPVGGYSGSSSHNVSSNGGYTYASSNYRGSSGNGSQSSTTSGYQGSSKQAKSAPASGNTGGYSGR